MMNLIIGYLGIGVGVTITVLTVGRTYGLVMKKHGEVFDSRSKLYLLLNLMMALFAWPWVIVFWLKQTSIFAQRIFEQSQTEETGS